VAGGSKIGPVLLAAAGFAMVLAGFETDPDISDGPQTWQGLIHGLAYLLFIFSSPLSFFFVGWRSRKDPLWRGYDLYTLISGVLVAILFFAPGSPAFYFFLFLFLAWIEVTAPRLYSLADAPVGQTAPAR
jgi:hypothetical protein